MECREVERLLPDYSVGLLKPRLQEAVASHLGRCPACGREWRTLQGVMHLVEEFGALEPPAGLWNGIYNRIVGEAPEPAPWSPWRRLWLRPAQWAASTAALAALAAGLWTWQGHREFLPVPPGRADGEMVSAVREHVLASADGLFADRTGLESIAVLASRRASGTEHMPHSD